MRNGQQKFYAFRNKYDNVIINDKYTLTTLELKEVIDNRVVRLSEISKDCWKILLDDNIVDNNNIIYIKSI